ncbi:MAG: Gx transporter family protein [Eubacterium sp.]|nr:Gx transporter family protein [Eubacterium sp.]
MRKSKKVAVFALSVALAFTLSFLETLIPINIGVPGVKIGLSNLVVVSALYLLDKKQAFAISMIKILISGLVFSGAFSLLYSFAGGILSFFVMLLAMKSEKISILGVSVIGGVLHNIAQIIVAAIVMQTPRIVYYLPVLLISGVAAGIVIGVISKILVQRLLKANLK